MQQHICTLSCSRHGRQAEMGCAEPGSGRLCSLSACWNLAMLRPSCDCRSHCFHAVVMLCVLLLHCHAPPVAVLHLPAHRLPQVGRHVTTCTIMVCSLSACYYDYHYHCAVPWPLTASCMAPVCVLLLHCQALPPPCLLGFCASLTHPLPPAEWCAQDALHWGWDLGLLLRHTPICCDSSTPST